MGKLAISGGSPVAKLQTPPWPVHGEEEKRRLFKVLESGEWSWMGEMETSFNEAFAAFHGSKRSLLVTNGTHALQMAYEALDIGWGDEVLVPGTTWQATSAAVLDVNAVPVLVDVDPETWCIDPKVAEAAITSRTRCIAAVHLYGCMVDMDAIMELANRHGLTVVEDCAHQHGGQWRGKGVGTIGDIGTFSFQQSKVMTAGEGGGILVQDDGLFGRLDRLRNCGRFSPHLPDEEQRYLQSGNFRISEWQAAVLLGQLERLPEHLERREASAKRLNQFLAKAPGVRPLKRHEGVTRQSYYCYGFRFIPEEWDGIARGRFCEALTAEVGIGFGGVYAPLTHSELYQPHTKNRHRINDEYWARINPARYDLPNTERMASREAVVTSHVNLLLPPADMDKIGEAIDKIHRNQDELRA
jgi:L-glutamine:2-deoxy-scyllo-inosose/3-amino-2,3-dideoxy-scyllo-inosose aminotransferase